MPTSSQQHDMPPYKHCLYPKTPGTNLRTFDLLSKCVRCLGRMRASAPTVSVIANYLLNSGLSASTPKANRAVIFTTDFSAVFRCSACSAHCAAPLPSIGSYEFSIEKGLSCYVDSPFCSDLFYVSVLSRFYPSATSKINITTNPTANMMVARLECSPCDASGISSSTTT